MIAAAPDPSFLEASSISAGSDTQASLDEIVAQGKALLSLQDFDAAEKVLRPACALYPNHAKVWGLLATACWALGHQDDALAAIQRATEITPTEESIVQRGWMLFQVGELRAAASILENAAARFPQSFSAHQNLAQVYKRLRCWLDGARAAERACALDPSDFDMRESWAGCLFEADREHDALQVIDDGLRIFQDTSSRFQLLIRKARAHEDLDEKQAAIGALTEALALRPNDVLALRRLCSLTFLGGFSELGQPYLQRLYDIEVQQLPDNVPDGLAALWERTDEIIVDPDALEWAWELADKSQWTRKEWRAAAAWGQAAAVLFFRWRAAGSARKFHEIEELVEPPDLSNLSAAAIERGACFVVGAHIGPTTPVINFLARGNRGYRVIGSADRECREQGILIPITSNSTRTARAIAAEIRNGVTVGLTADDPLSRFYISHNFLGRQVELPAFVPKMIRMHAGASFWYFPMWHEGRIILELERLPDPLDDEPEADWCERWFRAYLAKLEGAMRSRPESLILFGGIWGNVNQAVLRARRKIKGRREVGILR